MKRQRHVYPTSEIAHLWAHQTQDSARNQCGNFYFKGDTIYSYGSHFPIARHVTGTRGRKAILFTTRSYSSTTSKHTHDVRRSIPAIVQRFSVRTPDDSILTCYQVMVDAIAESQLWLAAPPKRTRKLTIANRFRDLCAAIDDANQFAKWFGIRKRLAVPVAIESYREESKRIFSAKIKADAVKEKRAAERREQECLTVRSVDVPLWLANKSSVEAGCYYYGKANIHDLPEAYLRIQPSDSTTVETSHGATVPLSHIRRALPSILQIIASGQEWRSNGQSIKIGYYTLDRIDSDGTLHAGCHRFERSEILRFAGVVDSLEAI